MVEVFETLNYKRLLPNTDYQRRNVKTNLDGLIKQICCH